MFEVPRRRQAANNDADASMRVPYIGLGTAFVGQVAISGGGVDTYHDVTPLHLDGPTVLGGPMVFAVGGDVNVRVLVLGPARAVGSNLIARRVDGEWVASRSRGGSGGNQTGCPPLAIPIPAGDIVFTWRYLNSTDNTLHTVVTTLHYIPNGAWDSGWLPKPPGSGTGALGDPGGFFCNFYKILVGCGGGGSITTIGGFDPYGYMYGCAAGNINSNEYHVNFYVNPSTQVAMPISVSRANTSAAPLFIDGVLSA